MFSQKEQNKSDKLIKKTQKTKLTIYLTEEAEQAFTELYIQQLRKDRKIDRSMIACEAIVGLYKKKGKSTS